MRIEFITEDLSYALSTQKANINIQKEKKNGKIVLQDKSKKTHDAIVKIYNYLGDKLEETKLTFEKGKATINSKLPVGMYILTVLFGTGEKQSLKLIIKKEKARKKRPG